MAANDAHTVVAAYWAAAEARDWDTFADLVAEQVVYEAPQTRERVRGRAAYLRFNIEGFPGDWHLRVERIIAEGGHAASWIEFTDAGDHYPGLCFFDLDEEGRIARITDFWPAPTELPDSRAHLVERYDHPVLVRRYQPDDLDDMYRICVLTADSGQDATALFQDPRLPGHVYMAPYVTFEPSLAFVAEDSAGVGGYIVATLDSLAFAQRLERDWWPALRASYPERDPSDYLSVPERYAIRNIHHPWDSAAELVSRFPSHLHIDLLPRLQRRGIGRRLIATLISNLRDQGSPGLHLFVGLDNQKAAEFYRHVGFTELPATDVHIFAMDLTAGSG